MSVIDEISIYAVPPIAGPVDGFTYAGLKIVQTLNDMGIKTPWRDDASPLSISFCQPEWYSQSETQFRVGYTPWESTIIPEWWIQHMDAMDLMWTTSQWCKEVFINNGVTNEIQVVPHGIDTSEWTLTKRKFTPNRFIFFHMGEPASRKGGQMVCDAFLKVFGDNPNVHLWFKAHEWSEVRLYEPFGPITRHPRMRLFQNMMSIEELNGLYNSVHCMVYPSQGEGFGMIPFQSIATGMPTMLVDWGGVKEFSHYGVPIDYRVSSSGHDYHVGEWAFPDIDDLCEKMEDVYLNYNKYADSAFVAGQELRERFTWKKVIEEAIDTLKLRIKF